MGWWVDELLKVELEEGLMGYSSYTTKTTRLFKRRPSSKLLSPTADLVPLPIDSTLAVSMSIFCK